MFYAHEVLNSSPQCNGGNVPSYICPWWENENVDVMYLNEFSREWSGSLVEVSPQPLFVVRLCSWVVCSGSR